MRNYRTLQKCAIAISVLSIFYCSAEGAVSIAFGEASASRSLIFFGIQSGIEVASAAIVLWRFRKVAKPGEEDAALLSLANLRVERYGTWGIGSLIALLALATEATAIAGLVMHSRPDDSNASLIISASALVLMVLLWLPKRYLARALNSSTMAGEATCSLSCIQITIVLFVGALVYRLWRGGWWVDNATSLVLGLLFARDAWHMLSWVRDPKFNGGCCSGCAHGDGATATATAAAVAAVVACPPGSASSMEKGVAGKAVGVDVDVELGKERRVILTYRDLCECCNEKEECRNSDVCRCDASVSSSSEMEPCCVPIDANGAKCCLREVITEARAEPSSVLATPQGARLPFCAESNCCNDNSNANHSTKDGNDAAAADHAADDDDDDTRTDMAPPIRADMTSSSNSRSTAAPIAPAAPALATATACCGGDISAAHGSRAGRQSPCCGGAAHDSDIHRV